jgi:hypothetical protein
MAWNVPRTWSPGETVTAALLNQQIRDNENILKARIRDDGQLRTQKFGLSSAGAANVGAGETDLTGFTFSIASTDLVDGDGLILEGHGLLAANGNTKTLRLDLGGQKLIIVQTTQNGGAYFFRLRFTRYSVAYARVSGIIALNPAGGGAATTYALVSGVNADFNGAQTLKLTGQGAADADITHLELTALAAVS